MKLFIKVIRGDGCVIEVQENTKVLEVKKQVEASLKIPVSQQALVFAGKTLLDDKTIADYPKIINETKLHLVVKKPEPIDIALGRFLLKYYTENQSKLIVDAFMKDFNDKIKSLSLDDLERIATSYVNDENM